MQIDLNGKSVLVTGASRGIGKAIAMQLGASGARVAVHANNHIRQAEETAKAIGNGSAAFQADLSDMEQTKKLFDQVVEKMGIVDVLINNAGVALPSSPDAPIEDWLRIWTVTQEVNLQSPALLCKLAIAHFLERKSEGHIINISSRAAFQGDTPEYFAYAASKGGLVSLTRSIAKGYGKFGIKAFIIAPGFVRTNMAEAFIDRYGESHVKKDIALDRLTTPEDLVPLITLLASGMADHASGSTFHVNAVSYMQ